ncbi:EscU/YscU/HrcU family type III secretion system export apparatus switch protein [Rhizosaccharibacter radicis]|uniref:EscU/YscU/HrcU family type III secretion system export apparatus switch protein n=1 Tax=Rhizosaccharibacter radicis TaxID=2782605 RepID=A0ABT1VW64_9PROT|nr:EscU/YscU/HrcU family type III secretion system export apparatus switch protein [Acetobacteraceae bacterium KSS12]
MGGSSEDKTLPASAKKLREARKKGQVAKSKDFVSAVVTLAAMGFVVMQWNPIAARFSTLMTRAGDLSTLPLREALPPLTSQIADTAIAALAPLLLLVLMATIMASVISTGGLVLSLDPVMPKPEKLNPAEGAKKLVSAKGFIELIKSLFKLALLAAIAFSVIRSSLQGMVDLPVCGLNCTGYALHASMLPLAGAGALVFLVFGAGDMFLQRWLFLRDQRMSHTEMKNEHKNSEGNPQVKSAHKRERREAAGRRSGLNQATFLVTGARVAVAMRYSAADTKVPMSVARAEGEEVTRFVQESRRLKLPAMHDPATARALFDKVQIGNTIPRDLFTPVIMCMKNLGMLG